MRALTIVSLMQGVSIGNDKETTKDRGRDIGDGSGIGKSKG